MSTVKYYAGVIGYTVGTVVWSLDWVETYPGIAPVLDSTGLPAGKIAVVFTDPIAGGAGGTVTVTPIVNGLPASGGLTATVVVAIKDIRWYAPPTDENGTLTTGNPTSELAAFPPAPSIKYYAGVVDYTSGRVEWSLDWVEEKPGSIPVLDFTGLPQNKLGILITNPANGGGRGIATISAIVNGLSAATDITLAVTGLAPLTADNTIIMADSTNITSDMTEY